MMLRYSTTTALVVLLVGAVCAQDDLDSLFESVFNNPDNNNNNNPAAATPAPAPPPPPAVAPPQAARPVQPQPPPPSPTCSGDCVPYYLCNDNQIITDGTGIIDIRVGDDATVESECANYLDTCCEKTQVLVEPPPTYTPAPPVSQYSCGLRNADGLGFRITGNKQGESEYGEFPWMVAVLREDKVMDSTLNVYECGGSLIAPNVVLTAAHCVANKQQDTLLVRAGEWDTQTRNELFPHHDRRVREVIVHERFNKGSLFNDVALLIMDEPFVLAENVQPICLPPKNHNFDHSRCLASGWGKNVFGKEGKYQVILKKVELPVVPHQSCQQSMRSTRLGSRFILDKSFMCAGGEVGQDTCRGDGGSPLVCPVPGSSTHYYQAGIVAWGIGCGEKGIPGVYASVPMFRDWIDQQLSQRHVEAKHYTYA